MPRIHCDIWRTGPRRGDGARRWSITGRSGSRGNRRGKTEGRHTLMLATGPAKKVTIYVNEDTRHHLGPLYESILTYLMHKGVAGATASRAMAGFGAHGVLHTPKI